MQRFSLVCLFGAALAACQPQPEVAGIPYAADSGSLAIRCGVLIDGLADEPSTDRLVIIKDGRFTTVVEGGAETPPGMPRLDLSDYSCLPGLTNTHVHLASQAEDTTDYGVYYRRTTEEHNALVLKNAAENLLTGFTSIRNVGDWFPDAIYWGRDQIRGGKALGPRIWTAGPYMTIPAGGGDLVMPGLNEEDIPPAARTGVARGPEDFGQKAELALERGADFLKVIASGAVFSFGVEPGAPEMNQQEIEAVVAAAKAADKDVTAHVHSAQSARDAILAGARTLEHASLLDDEAIALAKRYGVALSMDVYNGTYTDTVGREQGYPEEILQRNFDTTEAQRVVFEKAYKLGVPILYGTDAAVLPHDMGGWQFGVMVERGMSPMDAIKSATSLPAEHFGVSDDIGAIETGRYGDLIAVKGDPLTDIDVMRNVDVVIKGGLIFKLAE